MEAFQALFDQLDRVTGTRAKVSALVEHFRHAPPEDAAWAMTLLLGKRRRRLITGRRLREILRDRGGLSDWLIDECHGQVGDSAETITLLWPSVRHRISPVEARLPAIKGDQPLHWWMEILLPGISTLTDDDQSDAVLALWQTVPEERHFIVNKLLTGGFRVGVSTGLISRAVAEAFGLEEDLVVQRLMGGFEPSAERFLQLTAPTNAEEQRSSGTPYPFFLASPLDRERLKTTEARDWRLEWKWDGIRGQLIHRGSGVYLWSRGEELVNDSFPELVTIGEALPDGTVLDGEVICWREADPVPRDSTSSNAGSAVKPSGPNSAGSVRCVSSPTTCWRAMGRTSEPTAVATAGAIEETARKHRPRRQLETEMRQKLDPQQLE